MNDTDTDSPFTRIDGETAAADARSRHRSQFLLAIAALAILWAFFEVLAMSSRFPDRIPVHFGFNGAPDGWADKSFSSIYGSIIAAAVLVAGMGLCLRLSPKWFNFPGKERMLLLPLHHQQHIIAPMRESLAWMGAGTGIGLALLCRQMWAVAVGDLQAVNAVPLLLGIAVGFIALALGFIHTRSRLRRFESPQ